MRNRGNGEGSSPADGPDASVPPLLSVVVPVYRIPAAFLRAHAVSLREQAFQGAEFLYVLDGPDAAALALLQEVFRGDSRFCPVVLPENGGVSKARNVALERARGAFVTFVDADDLLPPGTLAAYARATEAAPDLVVGPARGDICTVANRLALFPAPRTASPDRRWARFHAWANASCWGKLYGASVRGRRFDPGVRNWEDIRFLWGHLAALPATVRIEYLGDPVYAIVARPDSASRARFSPGALSACFDSLARLAETPLPAGAGRRTRRVRAAQLLLWCFVDALRAPPDAWAAALPHARAFLRAFRKTYAVPFLLRPLVRRRLSSPEALAVPTRFENILLWDVYRWATRTARAEPLLLTLLALVCPPLYRRWAARFRPLPLPTEDTP